MRRRTFLGVAAATSVAVSASQLPARAAAPSPQTVPALREWAAGSTAFTYHGGSRVVVDSAYSGPLAATAAVFAEDLRALTGTQPAVVNAGRAQAQAGDIFLTLNPANVPANPQGYRLEVAAVAAVAASTAAGAFYGTRTILQLLVQSRTIPGGVASDWPTYPERGVHIDTNQRKYSLAWWRNLIRDLSFVKLNQLSVMLYLKGFSDSEKAELTAFAARYHVEIVPVLSVPNHTGGTLNTERPDLALQATEQPAADSLDYTKPGALELMREWIERDIDKFPGRYWHSGADEFLNFPHLPMDWSRYPQFAAFARSVTGNSNAQPQDGYTWVMNWINALVKSHGKVMRIWNDQLQTGGIVPLDTDIVVEHWVQPASPSVYSAQALLSRGNPVLNFSEALYYGMGNNYPDPRWIYDEFRVTRFQGGEVGQHAGLRGARLATWMFQPSLSHPVEDNTEMYERLFVPLRSLAQVTWNSPKHSDFNGFQALSQRLGHAPGYLPLTPPVTAAAATLRDPYGRIAATARMGDQLRHAVQADPAGPFGAAVTIASGVAGRVVATADRDGRAVAFARTATGKLLYGRQAQPGGGAWTTEELAAGIVGDPSVVLDQVGRLTYFVRTATGHLLHGWQNEPADVARGWSSTQLTSGIAGDPVATMDGFGRLLYFVRTTAGELRHGWHLAPGGSAWGGGVLTTGLGGDPAIAIDSVGRVVYFVRTAAGELRHGWQVNVATGPWNSTILASGVAGRPVPWVDITGRVLYFIRTNDNRLLHGWQSQPSAGPWGSGVLASDVAADPAVIHESNGRVVYFVRTTGAGLYHGWQTTPASGPWNGAVLTTGIGDDPSVAIDRSGRVTYLVHSASGSLWHGWQNTPGDGPWQRGTLTI